jgi:hypothetical protein
MMGILVPKTCWGNKTTYFVASGWFFTFQYVDAQSHEHQIYFGYLYCWQSSHGSEVGPANKSYTTDKCNKQIFDLN